MFIEKSERLSAKWQRDLQAKKKTYSSPKRKRQAVKNRYEDKKNP